MLENAVIPFLIFITNPVGTSPQLGYPISAYQHYLERGESAPRQYHSLEKCESRLRDVQQQTREWLRTHAVLPDVYAVTIERTASMRCMPAGARPDAPVRGANTKPSFNWRIGSLDQYGYFKGQNLDLRYFAQAKECEDARSEMIANYAQKWASLYGQEAAKEKQADMRLHYKCHRVSTEHQYPNYPIILMPAPPERR